MVVVEILIFQTVQVDFWIFINQPLRREHFTMAYVNTLSLIITQREVIHILRHIKNEVMFFADLKTISIKVSEERWDSFKTINVCWTQDLLIQRAWRELMLLRMVAMRRSSRIPHMRNRKFIKAYLKIREEPWNRR